MKSLQLLLAESSSMHDHLCPRQVIGVRMGLMAGKLLQLDLPQHDKRLVTISETDGCTVDGISVVTGCTVGHRTLRIEDYGKVAATFIDRTHKKALRLIPRNTIRTQAFQYSPQNTSKWEAYLVGYQQMPDDEMFLIQEVELTISLERILSRPGVRCTCSECGEEVINGREIVTGDQTICKACAGDVYYRLQMPEPYIKSV